MKSKARVNYNHRQRGYKARDKEELINMIVKLHDSGCSQVEIANKLNINRGTIRRWNDELNFIESRPAGEAGKLKCKVYDYDENYFENVKTPNQAYIVGFITGDGTVYDRLKSKRLVIALAEQDQQVLIDIGKEMNISNAIKFRNRNKANEQNKYSLTINSTKMCNDLIALGIVPRKTGREKWISYNNLSLQWAYVRGIFDADGHIRVYERNGYKKARMGITGNPEMLSDIWAF